MIINIIITIINMINDTVGVVSNNKEEKNK